VPVATLIGGVTGPTYRIFPGPVAAMPIAAKVSVSVADPVEAGKATVLARDAILPDTVNPVVSLSWQLSR